MNAQVKGPVFVIIRFPITLFQACKNSLAKHYSVHRSYSGNVAGLSRSIQEIEGVWPMSRGVAILSFESMREAELWKDSVPEIRQHDWLDGVDLIIVPVYKMPPEGKRFVQLMEIEFKDYKQYITEYSQDTREYLAAASGAAGGIVSTSRVKHVKGRWNPSYLIVNFWSSPQDFEEAYNAESYQPLKEKRYMCASTNSVVFDLEPIFPRRHP